MTVIRQKAYTSLQNVTLRKSWSVLRGLGEAKTVPLGTCTARIKIDEMEVDHDFVVVLADNTISHDALLGFDLVARFEIRMDG